MKYWAESWANGYFFSLLLKIFTFSGKAPEISEFKYTC